jgi:cytoskeletal protein CcmA (bactofilin family)
MADPANHTTVIGPDTHIKGDMTFDHTARILGSFEGSISAKGELQIAEGAKCKATVEASKVVVDGAVEGNLTGRDRVELTAKARMKGDLVTARLVVAEGAAFVGHCTVGSDATKGQKPPEASRPSEAPQPPPVHETRPQGQQKAESGSRR